MRSPDIAFFQDNTIQIKSLFLTVLFLVQLLVISFYIRTRISVLLEKQGK